MSMASKYSLGLESDARWPKITSKTWSWGRAWTGGGSVDLKGNAFACARDGGRHKKHANEWRGNRASAGTGGGESRRTGRSSTVVLFCFRSLTRRRVLFTCGATS